MTGRYQGAFSVGLLLVLMCALLAGPVGAQTHGGTGVLKIKPGGRATGMGQSGVALDQRAHALWWNPAMLADVSHSELSSTVAKLVPDLADDVYYLNVALASSGLPFLGDLGEGIGVAIDVMYLSYGKTEAIDTENVSHGYFSSYEFVPVIGAGIKLYSGEPGATVSDINFGAAVKYVLVDLAPAWAMRIVGVDKDGRADAYGADIGFNMRGHLFIPYSIGVNVQNLGSELVFIEADQGDPLPRNLKAGIGLNFYESEVFQLRGSFDFNKALIVYDTSARNFAADKEKIGWGDAKELLNVGVECSLHERLHFRVGYVDDPEGEIEAATFGAGLDVAFGADRTVRFDYSSVPQALDLARVSYLSVGMQF